MSFSAVNFDPKAPQTVKSLQLQMGSGILFDYYAVVDDCGACIVAGFDFIHHAEAFSNLNLQMMYIVDSNGLPVDGKGDK